MAVVGVGAVADAKHRATQFLWGTCGSAETSKPKEAATPASTRRLVAITLVAAFARFTWAAGLFDA